MPVQSLRLQATELDFEYCSLPLAQAIIRAVNEMAVEPLPGHSSAIMHGTGLALEVVVVRDNHAALASRHELAGLKAEGRTGAERADLFPAPLTAMSVGGILDQSDTVFPGNIA